MEKYSIKNGWKKERSWERDPRGGCGHGKEDIDN